MKKNQKIKILLVIVSLSLLLSGCGVPVEFDPGEGSVVSGEVKQRVKDDAPAIPPTVEREGYVFAGWDGNYETPEEKTTVNAIWKKLFTVTFDTNGGVAADESLLTQSVADGDGAIIPQVTREGYEFDSWDRDLSVVTADSSAKAMWTKLYQIYYDVQGGVANDEKLLVQTIREGTEPTEPTVTKDKYIFKGWERKDYEEKSAIKYTAIWERRAYDATEIYALINPATVEVSTYRRNSIPLALGSGFFIKDNGTFVTNYHVIEEAYSIKIKTSDSTEYKVTRVLYFDKQKDIAILQADVKGKKMPYLEYSDELPTVGEVTYALGSSLGLTGTFSSGIVSYVNRTVNNVKFIQSTAPISSGNSGGPLVNKYGQVIGINTATYTEGQNLNLSIAVSEIDNLKYANISVNQFFMDEATFLYYLGEICVSEKESSDTAQSVNNGNTVNGRFTNDKDMDLYLTKATSKTNRVMIIITTENYENLLYIYGAAGMSKSSSASSSRNMYGFEDESMIEQYIGKTIDGKYALFVFFDIPADKYDEGYVYYGVGLMYRGKGALDYQYFAYNITEAQYKELVKNVKK